MIKHALLLSDWPQNHKLLITEKERENEYCGAIKAAICMKVFISVSGQASGWSWFPEWFYLRHIPCDGAINGWRKIIKHFPNTMDGFFPGFFQECFVQAITEMFRTLPCWSHLIKILLKISWLESQNVQNMGSPGRCERSSSWSPTPRRKPSVWITDKSARLKCGVGLLQEEGSILCPPHAKISDSAIKRNRVWKV